MDNKKGNKKFCIDINIRVKTEEDEIKSYNYSSEYEGDPAKLDVSVMIDGWFIENNIDKKSLIGFSAYVNKIMDEDEMLKMPGGFY